MSAKLTFWSGVGTVTGANFMLDDGSTKVLVDCGMTQGTRDDYALNAEPFPYEPSSVSHLFVTHAHIDHIGRIGKLVHDGFEGEIWSHPATKELSSVMLPDALAVLRTHARERGREPYFNDEDIRKAMSLWKTFPYHEKKGIGGYEVELKDAGHVLGSSMIEFSRGGKTIVFTGDLGNSPSPLLRDTEWITDADYMVMESVYGDKNHEEKEERVSMLREAIDEVAARKGVLVIPAFTLERTQMLLYEINNMVEEKGLPPMPVFVDSPLASKVTTIYGRYSELMNDKVKGEMAEGDDIFEFPKLKFTVAREDSSAIAKKPNPKIIIAGSGMSSGGRVLSHEASYAPDPNATILLVGYQAAGTLGRQLMDGAKEITISGRKIPVRAKIRSILGFSSHKDSEHLIEFVEKGSERLKKVFVAMGEPKSSMFLAQRLRDYLGVDAVYPERGKAYELDF